MFELTVRFATIADLRAYLAKSEDANPKHGRAPKDLRSLRRPWSEQEDAYIVEYADQMSRRNMASYLGRTSAAVRNRLVKLRNDIRQRELRLAEEAERVSAPQERIGLFGRILR